MPALNGAWRAICRFLAGGRAPASSDSDTGGNATPGRNGAGAGTPAGSSRLHRLYELAREQMLEAQRNNRLTMYEEMRTNRQARRRALGLLVRLMSQEQREEFRRSGQFHVIGGSSGTHYRIRVAMFANIDVLHPDGRVKHRLCAHPAGDVPVYDVMAAQMLHLQDPTTEHRFLQQANIHPALSEDRVRSRSLWTA
ncbi:hypothetical protein [Noviherbaspirillum massiliense]|uniref:hypothetical protein n=1 Tax=Noviherbaspirillum massiliense TaxID=1465823 RepID=UPI0002EE11D6|nr:hypothetical protein [Noviherbaspirillum massiliense]